VYSTPALPTFTSFAGIEAIASSPWAYPVLESLHIIGIGLLLGSLVLLELRVWGQAVALPVQALARLALPVTVAGFALAVLSGLLLFAAAPAELLAKRLFILKMGLLMLAGLNAMWFHARHGLQRLDGVARAQALLSLVLWAAVIFSGRWLAYV
jgi:hypothetical protein